MADFPRSLLEFQRRFPTDQACGEYLLALRCPSGFVCPACGHGRGWRLDRPLPTFECAGCHRQTSVTAGTVLHRSHLPLTTWFWAAYLMATHSNGISALQLKGLLGIGSYKTAWLLARKLRRAMVDPQRLPLAGLVEVDESSLPQRRKDDPPSGGQGRSGLGKMPIAGAVELADGRPRRLRLATIADYSADSLHAFIAAAVAPTSTIKSDAWSGYPGAPVAAHEPHTIGAPRKPPSRLPSLRDRMIGSADHGGPPRPALGPPCLQQPQALGHRPPKGERPDFRRSAGPKAGEGPPITACAPSTCRPTLASGRQRRTRGSTSSSSASTDGTTATPPSTASSASASSYPTPATRC